MLVAADLEKALVTVLKLVIDDTEYPVIRDEQNSPRPSGEYATVHYLGLVPSSLEQKKYTDNGDDLDIETKSVQRAYFGLKFFKGDSQTVANKVRRRLVWESATDLLHTYGMGLAERSRVRNATERLENGLEDRAAFNVFFNVVESDVETIGTIEEATVSGSYESQDGSIEEIEININE